MAKRSDESPTFYTSVINFSHGVTSPWLRFREGGEGGGGGVTWYRYDFHSSTKLPNRYKSRSELVSIHDSYRRDISYRYHANKYRATSGNRDELVPGWKSHLYGANGTLVDKPSESEKSFFWSRLHTRTRGHSFYLSSRQTVQHVWRTRAAMVEQLHAGWLPEQIQMSGGPLQQVQAGN